MFHHSVSGQHVNFLRGGWRMDLFHLDGERRSVINVESDSPTLLLLLLRQMDVRLLLMLWLSAVLQSSGAQQGENRG